MSEKDKSKLRSMDKALLKDSSGRYLTQSLFIEYQYDPSMAIYSIEGVDRVYKGKFYPSLKKRYLSAEDPVEYQFANQWLFDWDHWQRLQKNKWCMTHITKWRNELEILLASKGIQKVLDLAEDGNFQAAKYAADRQWIDKKRGRPSKQQAEREAAIKEALEEEFNDDASRLNIIPLKE